MLGTIVFVMAFYEGYSRLYVQKHWVTDVISGIIFGPALFLGYAIAACILAGGRATIGPASATTSGSGEAAFTFASTEPGARNLTATAAGVPLDLMQRLTVSTCSVSAVSYWDDGARILCVNSSADALVPS